MAPGLKKLQARFYETGAGRKPVKEWLLSLPKVDRRVLGKDIQKVEFGRPIGMPYCRSLGHGLWEVRSDMTGGTIARVVFCIVGGEMVLLHGFVKKTQRTPPREIELSPSNANGSWTDGKEEKKRASCQGRNFRRVPCPGGHARRGRGTRPHGDHRRSDS